MPFTVTAASKDNPLLAMLVLEQLEQRAVDGVDPEVLEGAGWLGYDLDKLWLDFEMQRADGQTQVSEWQLRYSRAILPYWDWQLGLRRDFEPGPRRNWLAIGLNGLAPYWFEVDISLFLGRSGRSALRAEAEYELMLTQRWALVPEIEVNAHAHNDMKTGVGSGLSEIEAGLRLRYEVRREFAPYIGINWEKAYGNTKRFEREAGERSEEGALVFGLRAWF
ncbi:MAG: copper resistance protein B [Gammaproteobacteria bacterium]|nr:copper resistance protein B [Gammaproteobacteria bacterium]NND38196.1 copper resistance protein B [Pseudomonadales bacterium]MBT8150077.1 copper resistance protein B [Gammaproteobacteria bacterium]NNL11697.1 copper resistance protein B [Pseudomonadales bacterium]NNM12432.1 copper resistance protein B [Pseudomonadales bacterium]